MASKCMHLEKSSKSLLTRTNFSRQGMFLSKRTNIKNFPYQSSIDVIKSNASPHDFESIFQSFYPNLTKKVFKSDRRYFKSASHAEISQLKIKIQQQNKKREQKSLKSLLFSHRHPLTERQNKTNEKKQQKILLRRNSPNSKLNLKEKINQTTTGDLLKQKNNRSLLESTNFSIRAIPCINRNQQDESESEKMKSSHSNIKRKQLQNSSRPFLSSTKQQTIDQNCSINTYQQNKQDQYIMDQIQIKLSIKSMTKSEQGQCSENPEAQRKQFLGQQQNDNLKNLQKQQISVRPANDKRPIYTTRNHRQNRLVIKFDKRALFNASEINDPCLRIERINTRTSKVKTQPNL